MKSPDGCFDSQHLHVLCTALDLTCRELGIEQTDKAEREHIAFIILAVAHTEPFNAESLKVHAVASLENSVNVLPWLKGSEPLNAAGKQSFKSANTGIVVEPLVEECSGFTSECFAITAGAPLATAISIEAAHARRRAPSDGC